MPASVLLVRAIDMDKFIVKRNILIVFTGGIVCGGIVPLIQSTTRVTTYFHTVGDNRACRWKGLMAPREAVHLNLLLDWVYNCLIIYLSPAVAPPLCSMV